MNNRNMENKWLWMMDYCKNHRLPAAQAWAWDQAKNAWEEYIKNMGSI